VFNIEAAAPDVQTYEADRLWARNFRDAMRPHATGSGGYMNFMVEADDDRVRASYGDAKYQRLAAIKRQYDPDNIFRLNVNTKPM
jgi:FAD/FMN-containing dehydrogenase